MEKVSTRRRAWRRTAGGVGVIELMPTANDTLYAFKYVNGHPKSTSDGLQTVAAMLACWPTWTRAILCFCPK